MIKFEIPGIKTINARFLVLDYNGTLAKDGIILSNVMGKLNQLSELLSIYIITADTFGDVKSNIKDVKCECVIISGDSQGKQKLEFVRKLGFSEVIAIGNGANDALMIKEAVLGIAIIQKEGASVNTILNANIVCTNILDALDLLLNPLRVKASLRD